jgi:predicted transcriptional regulator
MKRHRNPLSLASSNEQPATQTSVDTLIAATSQIVSAYLVNRPTETVNITALTAEVFATLRGLAQEEASSIATTASGNNLKPVVAINESVKADYLVCLEDGKRVKMLKRYLKTSYNMTPEEYRARWSLPAN